MSTEQKQQFLPANPLDNVAQQYLYLLNNGHNALYYSDNAGPMACHAITRARAFFEGMGVNLTDLPEPDPTTSDVRLKKDPANYYDWYFKEYSPKIDKLLGLYIFKQAEAIQKAYGLPTISFDLEDKDGV